MKLRSVVSNLLVFLYTCLSSVWLFHQVPELRDKEILQPPSSSRFQRVGHLPTEHRAIELQFINENIGWCADLDNLWYTDDGGKTWQLINSNSGARSFHFINAQSGWMNNGELYRTEDGGHTWTPIVTPMSDFAGSLWSFHLEENGQVGWIAGGIFYPMEKPWFCINTAAGFLKDGSRGCLNGAVFRTDDGGLTWRQQPTTRYIGRFISITFVDEKHGWVAGDADVLHTTAGGDNWSSNRFKKGCEDYYALQDIHPTGVSVSDQKNGLLIFGSGLIAKSTDGGNTWCGIADLPTSASPDDCRTELPGKFRDIAFRDADHGIALDCLGVMFESSDGGATWRKLEDSMQFDRILFHDKKNAWVATRNAELIKVDLLW